jgi:hypothetical protein
MARYGMGGNRATLTAVVAALALLGAAGTSAAQGKAEQPIGGKYEVRFEEVQNSCSTTGMSLSRANIELTERARRVDVTIPMVPAMSGTVSKGGKFKARAKRGRTAIEGVEGSFSVAGRVSEGIIQLVFIAEYFKGKKPLCTQSWNASGVNKDKL